MDIEGREFRNLINKLTKAIDANTIAVAGNKNQIAELTLVIAKNTKKIDNNANRINQTLKHLKVLIEVCLIYTNKGDSIEEIRASRERLEQIDKELQQQQNTRKVKIQMPGQPGITTTGEAIEEKPE